MEDDPAIFLPLEATDLELLDVLALPPVTHSFSRSSLHVRHEGLSIYLRRAHNPWNKIHKFDFTISSIGAENRGQGQLTALLDILEPQYDFTFESVINDRLESYLIRRGYKPHPVDALIGEITHYTWRKRT